MLRDFNLYTELLRDFVMWFQKTELVLVGRSFMKVVFCSPEGRFLFLKESSLKLEGGCPLRDLPASMGSGSAKVAALLP